jgi:eukaryotic-like serine/threonine-protein kinase
VFRAHDPAEGRLVAVKVFASDLPPAHATRLIEALQEVAARGLDHPAIAAPIAAGIEGGLPWLAQAYVPAESLGSAVAQFGAPPLTGVLTIVTHVAGALDFAAAAGVLHGALHPGDVLVTPDETYLLDVGVAGALHAAGIPGPAHPPYAAPEVMRGAAPARAADVFALAAIAFELLAGDPVQGLGDEAAARLPDIPGAHRDTLVETFAFALAGPTDERFPTALGFAAALKRALADAPGQWVAPRRAPTKPQAAAAGAALALEAGGVSDTPADLALLGGGADEPADAREPAPGRPESRRPRRRGARDESPAPAPAPVPPPEPEPLVVAGPETGPSPSDLELHYEPLIVPEPSGTLEPADGEPVPARFTDVGDEPRPEPTALALDDAPAAAESAGGDIHLRRDAEPAPDWDVVAPPPPVARPPRPAAPPVRGGHPTAARGPSRALIAAAIVIVAVLVAAATGYFLGRGAPEPASFDARAGADTTPGGAGEGAAAAATELEMPPEPIPEPLDAAPQGAAGTPPPAAEPVESPASARPTAPPAAAPPRSRPEPAPRATAPLATGQIVVRSKPAGARVELNGKPRGETPLTMGDLPLGAYDIRLTRQGYIAEQRRVTLTRGRPSHTVTVPMRRQPGAATGTGTTGRAAPAATHAPVLVDSRPRGATVFMNGRRVGITPLQVPSVSVGRHVFRFELAGYRPVSADLVVEPGEPNRVAVSLEEENR